VMLYYLFAYYEKGTGEIFTPGALLGLAILTVLPQKDVVHHLSFHCFLEISINPEILCKGEASLVPNTLFAMITLNPRLP